MKFFTCYGNSCSKEKRWLQVWFSRLDPEIERIIIMRMNLVAFFVTITIMNVCASAHAQSITLSEKQSSLKEVLIKIKKQSGFQFWYNKTDIQKAKPVTVHLNKVSLKEALDHCFEGQELTYEIIGKIITVKAKVEPAKEKRGSVFKRNITGKVTDEKGIPLPNVSVSVKGTSKRTITDDKGSFSIETDEDNAVLVFSYVGYQTEEISVKGSSSLNVTLKESAAQLDQVQVIGYGTTTKRLNTGSVGTVTAEEIGNQPVSNPLATLQGRVPGMVITQTTGLPGGAFKVEVRGRTAIDRSISDDQPLFIIDGVPIGANNGLLSVQSSAIGDPSRTAFSNGGISPLSGINPQDIESIDVLKDADATAIYGSRGANGVILITTKKGKAGKTSIVFNGATGISNVSSQAQMMNTRQYVNMRKTAFANDGTKPTAANAYDLVKWDTTRYTNYMDLFTAKTAATNDVQLSISGGSESTQFLLGGSFNRQTSVLPGDQSYRRGTMHFNVNHSSTNNRFKLNFSGSLNMDQNNLIQTDLSSYNYLAPNLILYDSKGGLAWNEGGVISFSNPLSYLLNTYDAKNKGVFNNVLMSYLIVEGLTLRLSAGYNTTILKEISLNPIASVNPAYANVVTGASTVSDNQFTSWIVEPQAEYVRLLGKGRLTVLLGATAQATDQDSKTITASGYTTDDMLRSLAGATSLTAVSQADQYRYNAFFGRINYNWQDRYLVNISGRRDGSSRFAPENRFANFGAIGAAWLFSNEDFIKRNLSFLSFGKLRGSYGITGNDKITNYQYLDTWASSFSTYNGNPGLYPNKLYNPQYHWEKNKKLEFALELGFLNDKVLLSTAYYNNRSSNQLVQYPLPTVTGFNNIIDNLPALVENRGWEFTLSTTNIKRKDFVWTTTANMTIPRNRLVSYPGLTNSSYNSVFVEGQSLNVIYRYKYTGVDPQTGLYGFQDVDGNGKFDAKDRQVLGETDPKFFGGLANTISYKGFQLDFFFSFTKQTGRNYLYNLRSMAGTLNNLPAVMEDFWTKPGDNAQFQKLSNGSSAVLQAWNRFKTSDGIYSDASYIRLKNVALSYNLPTRWTGKIGLTNCRVYMQGQNLWTITDYQVADPETQSLLRTAPMRTITAGIQFGL